MRDITDGIYNGNGYLYNLGDPNYYSFYKDKNTNRIYEIYSLPGEIYGTINEDNFEKIDYDYIRTLLPKRDYIGGTKKDVALKIIDKVPNLRDTILSLASKYGISADLFAQRIGNEGWLQNIARDYNTAAAADQKTFPWQDYMDNEINGFNVLGLDTFGDLLKSGKLNLRRNIDYEDMYEANEDGTGRVYNSGIFQNAYDALEAKAAVFEYFTKIAKERSIPEEDLDAYVNAMYNMGPYHKDLNNMDYVRRTYRVTPYFKLGGILKAQGGTGNLLTPDPLSPIGIALNTAKAMAKMKGEQQHSPSGVKEVVGPDGKKVAIRTEQPLQPLEQSIAEWLPGTGDVAEVEQIANDVKNGNLGSATLGAGLLLLPGNAGKLLKTKIGTKISNFLDKNLFNYDELWARVKHPT
jgi:hypothetical protein